MQRVMRRRGAVNTGFGFMDPRGKKTLTRFARSPSQLFDDAEQMATRMQSIAKKHSQRPEADSLEQGLPLLANVRLALNVTECDSQQLVIVRGTDANVASLMKRLGAAAWSDELIGRFLYVRSDDKTDWSVITGSNQAPASGLLVVRTEPYGLKGSVVASASAEEGAEALVSLLRKAASEHRPKPTDTRRLRRKGIRNGVQWRTELPAGRR